MRKGNKKGSTIKVKLRWSDFSTITRQKTLDSPTDDSNIIFDFAKLLFYENWIKGQPVRLLGVGVSNFEKPIDQLSLWDTKDIVKQTKIIKAIKEINKKFGDNKIFKGSLK